MSTTLAVDRYATAYSVPTNILDAAAWVKGYSDPAQVESLASDLKRQYDATGNWQTALTNYGGQQFALDTLETSGEIPAGSAFGASGSGNVDGSSFLGKIGATVAGTSAEVGIPGIAKNGGLVIAGALLIILVAWAFISDMGGRK